MKLSLKKINNIHQNEDCIIVGSGHTMNEFDYTRFTGKIILIGSTILRINKKIVPDYLISCNNIFPVINIKEHLNFLNQYKKMAWVMCDTCCYQDIWNYETKLFDQLKINYVFFDDRHYKKEYCIPKKNCCRLYDDKDENENLIENVEKKFKIKLQSKKKQGSSVFDSALMIALILGFKNIYIQGVDLPSKKYHGTLSKKYFGYKSKLSDKFINNAIKLARRKYFIYYIKNLEFKPYFKSFIDRIKIFFKPNYSVFNEHIKTSIKIYKWLGQISKKNKVNLYCLSKKSRLNKIKGFKYIETS